MAVSLLHRRSSLLSKYFVNIYIYIYSLVEIHGSASRYNSSRHHRETILDERENDLKKDKEREGGEGGKK